MKEKKSTLMTEVREIFLKGEPLIHCNAMGIK
jgi:hypothetical protein